MEVTTAPGLLKEELRRLGSGLLAAATQAAVPAGAALAVDRDKFSLAVNALIENNSSIILKREKIDKLPAGRCIVAAGPLCDGPLAEEIQKLTGAPLHFYDAAAPVVYADSLDYTKCFRASRYGKGSDYINCPMTQEEYTAFIDALATAECAPVHGFEDSKVFEGCLPCEVLARRGPDALRFGACKPVGLTDPATGKRPYAVIQLRAENNDLSLYNMVGFQTRLTFSEQKRVFGMVPALHVARYARQGVMHRNTFISSPGILGNDYRMKNTDIWFAGQITGTEGYLAAIAGGYTAALGVYNDIAGKNPPDFTSETVIGGLAHYASGYNGGDYQPMGPNFGLLAALSVYIKKKDRREALVNRALNHIEFMIS